MKNRATFKYNNGDLALLCSNCRAMIKEGKDFTDEERAACSSSGMEAKTVLPKQYCEKCKKLQIDLRDRIEKVLWKKSSDMCRYDGFYVTVIREAEFDSMVKDLVKLFNLMCRPSDHCEDVSDPPS